MAQYKKRKDGRYITSLTLDGKKYYLYGNTIKELDRKKIEMISKYEQGKSLKSNNVRFKDYKWIWYETKKPMISAKSQQSYKSILNNHFTLIDYKKVSEIKKTDKQGKVFPQVISLWIPFIEYQIPRPFRRLPLCQTVCPLRALLLTPELPADKHARSPRGFCPVIPRRAGYRRQ